MCHIIDWHDLTNFAWPHIIPYHIMHIHSFVYVPLCFAYILPVSKFHLFNNAIPAEVSVMNKKPFIVMGLLDCITCILLTFAAVYLPGSLLILLPQAAIPISMILSKHIKGESYFKYQYLGAVVVVLGILVVLEPLVTQRHVADYTCLAYDEHEFCALCSEETTEEGCLSHGITSGGGDGGSFVIHEPWNEDENVVLRSLIGQNDTSTPDQLCHWVPSSSSSSGSSTSTTLLWSVVTILACIPMTLSSIYKELSLSGSQQNLDPIFLNGWVAFYQLLFSFPLSVPAGMTSSPPVPPHELPQNIWDGIKCYLGIATITTGCHPDDQCHLAPLYVNVFLVFNVCFNILIVYVLKYGSANVLFMASTVMVPIGNLAFTLPFMPGSTPLKDSDIAGLLVILLGLVTYRFGNTFKCRVSRHWMTIISPLSWRRRAKKRSSMLNGGEQFEWQDAPLYDDVNGSRLEEPLITPFR